MKIIPIKAFVFAAALAVVGCGAKSDNDKGTDTNYVFSDYHVEGTNTLSTYVKLDSSQKYGIARYKNDSADTVRLSVEDRGTIYIDPGEDKYISWEKGGFLRKGYGVDLYCAETDLDGIFTAASSDSPLPGAEDLEITVKKKEG